MPQYRTFYASQALAVAPFDSPTAWTTVRGAQSVGVNTKFNLEQVFEIGQLAIYENIENVPDVELTAEKVLDGYAPLYHLATQGAVSSSLVGRSNQRCHVALSIYADTVNLASGAPLTQCVLSGMYLSQVGYDIMVEGNAKESVTLVGNNKAWKTSGFTFSGFTPSGGVTDLGPAAASGVNRRQDLVMTACRFPTSVRGISASGTNEQVSGCYNASIQSIKVSANLGREQMMELGRKAPYFRYVNFPVEVSTTIEINGKDGDLVACVEDQDSTAEEAMRFKLNEGLAIDLGSKNRLNSVNYGGANAGSRGGNATVTYQYQTFNDFDVRHPQDPMAISDSGNFYPLF